MANSTKRKRVTSSSVKAREDKLAKLKDQTPTLESPSVESPARIAVTPDVDQDVIMEDGTVASLVPIKHLKAIKKAGIDVEATGAISIANGYSVVTKQGLYTAIEAVSAKLTQEEDSKVTVALAKAIGYCANSMAKMIGEFRQINAMKKPDKRPKNKSFVPGTFVKGGQMVFNGPVQMNVGEKK